MKMILWGLAGFLVGNFLVSLEPVRKLILEDSVMGMDPIDQLFYSLDKTMLWVVMFGPCLLFLLIGWAVERRRSL